MEVSFVLGCLGILSPGGKPIVSATFGKESNKSSWLDFEELLDTGQEKE